MKLSRREFLKYIAVLGSIAPIFDIDAIREANFSYEKLKSISEIENITKVDFAPYYLPRDNFCYYYVYLKTGERLSLDTNEIEERYGDILPYLIEHGRDDLKVDNSWRVIWNS
jgi:hypothetical protein